MVVLHVFLENFLLENWPQKPSDNECYKNFQSQMPELSCNFQNIDFS